MLAAAYGLRLLHVAAWWAGPVMITATLLVTLRRTRQRQNRPAGEPEGRDRCPPDPHAEPTDERKPASMDIVELIMADHHLVFPSFAVSERFGRPG